VLGLALPGQTSVTESGNSTVNPTEGNQGVEVLPDIPGECPSADSSNTVSAECTANTTSCVSLVCNISSQRSGYNGQLSISGYVDEAYYKNTNTHYNLRMDAEYEVLDKSSSEDNRDDNTFKVSLFIFNPNVPTEQRPVEAWVIVVPIIIVLLVMGVVIAILWVGGFFKRKRNKNAKQSEDDGNEVDNEKREGANGDNSSTADILDDRLPSKDLS
jgi:hypothetical protein